MSTKWAWIKALEHFRFERTQQSTNSTSEIRIETHWIQSSNQNVISAQFSKFVGIAAMILWRSSYLLLYLTYTGAQTKFTELCNSDNSISTSLANHIDWLTMSERNTYARLGKKLNRRLLHFEFTADERAFALTEHKKRYRRKRSSTAGPAASTLARGRSSQSRKHHHSHNFDVCL